VPQGSELGGSNKWIDRKVYLVNRVLKGAGWFLTLPRKRWWKMQLQREMAGASTAQREGTNRARRQEGGQAGKETVRQKKKQKKTQAWNVPRGRGAACASTSACWTGRLGGGLVDLLMARQNGSPAGPMTEVENEAPKIRRPLAWLRDCPVQKDDAEGRS
jgi:hypothetical protein